MSKLFSHRLYRYSSPTRTFHTSATATGSLPRTPQCQIHFPPQLCFSAFPLLDKAHTYSMSTQTNTDQTDTDSVPELLSQLAAAVLSVRELSEHLRGACLDAAGSAICMGLLEKAERSINYAQLVVTHQAELSQVHRLDPVVAQQIDELVADPAPLADGSATVPAQQLCKGMSPYKNPQAFIQGHLHISAYEAKRRLTGARLLVAPAPPESTDTSTITSTTPSFPLLAQAAADGSADVGNLANLAGQLEGIKPRFEDRSDAQDLSTAIEDSLVHQARNAEPSDCAKTFRDWKGVLASDGSPMTEEEIIARRGIHFRGFRDGSDEYLLRCSPEFSEVLQTLDDLVLNPRSTKRPPFSDSTRMPGQAEKTTEPPIAGTASGTPTYSPVGTPAPDWSVDPELTPEQIPLSQLDAGMPPDPFPIPDDDPRTKAQLLLDVLIWLCAAAINGDSVDGSDGISSETGGLHATINVTIDYLSLLGRLDKAGITAHGMPISAASIRRMACNADIIPAVLGTKGELLDLGRTSRGFSKAQRKALAIRDRGCTVPGCHRSAATSEAHHVKPWSEGGETSVENGLLICGYHHLQVHAGLITMKMIGRVPYLVARAGRPRGDPERNLYWHPELLTSGYTPPLFGD